MKSGRVSFTVLGFGLWLSALAGGIDRLIVEIVEYMSDALTAGGAAARGPRGDGTRQHTRNRRTHRRVTHNEKRYHSGILAI